MTGEIVVLHLYPRQLGLNGDVGNVLALERRAAWRGGEVRVVAFEPGDELPDAVHLVHIGSGPRTAQLAVADDVDRIAPRLRAWADAGVPFLAIAAGWQLLGQEILDVEGVARPGGGVFPSRVRLASARAVGEVAGDSELGELTGFENHGGITKLLEGAQPLARLSYGRGNDAEAERGATAPEGVLAGVRIGTNLHGPFLPMNPVWADHLLDAAARLAGVELRPVAEADAALARVDEAAAKSREAVRRRVRV